MYNVSYINWFILVLSTMIIFTPWRSLNTRAQYINNLYLFILICFTFSQFFFFFCI
jgi:hypothetical protein